MLFQSPAFIVFFAVVIIFYQALSFSHRSQNALLLAASFFFYGYWDIRCLALILITILSNYYVSLRIEEAGRAGVQRAAKRWLWAALALNLGILGYFKYFNFFTASFEKLLTLFGFSHGNWGIQVLLPAGISFYTFQTLSYTIDVYRGRQLATKNWIDFALFVSFFPQLIAGPIERSKSLLSQIRSPRSVTREGIYEGFWLFLWGFFKKVFIADNLSVYLAWAFSINGAGRTADIYLAAVTFAIVFYADFSGYTDMARGLSKFFGIELSRNFNQPYFATDPLSFWQRWHMTLSAWFRDYVYAPLRGKGGSRRQITALFLTMTLVGLWHGANWTFVVWGMLWGIVLIVTRALKPRLFTFFRASDAAWKNFAGAVGAFLTFHIWVLLGFIFTSETLSLAMRRIEVLFKFNGSSAYFSRDLLTFLYFTTPLLAYEIYRAVQSRPFVVRRRLVWHEAAICFVLVVLLLTNGAQLNREFIYFQF
jgi:D-alanyl-lipoteichoic acid acyltransferase DltB (MBOAT superfamily)